MGCTRAATLFGRPRNVLRTALEVRRNSARATADASGAGMRLAHRQSLPSVLLF
jgi:hypothetical protein